MYDDYKSRISETSNNADWWLKGATEGRSEGDIKGLRENIFGHPVMGPPAKALIEYYIEEDKYNQNTEGYQPLLPRVNWTAEGLVKLIENTDTHDPMFPPVELGEWDPGDTPFDVIDFDDLERRRIAILRARAETGEVPFVAWDDVHGNRQVRFAPENKLEAYDKIGDAITESLEAGTITERDIDLIGLLLKKEEAPKQIQTVGARSTQHDLLKELGPMLYGARAEALSDARAQVSVHGTQRIFVEDPLVQAANAVYLQMMGTDQALSGELPPDEGVWSLAN